MASQRPGPPLFRQACPPSPTEGLASMTTTGNRPGPIKTDAAVQNHITILHWGKVCTWSLRLPLPPL